MAVAGPGFHSGVGRGAPRDRVRLRGRAGVSSLIPLGAAGIIASVVPVNDPAAVPLMLVLHDALQRGAALPEALLAVRQTASGNPLATATALSFVALGR